VSKADTAKAKTSQAKTSKAASAKPPLSNHPIQDLREWLDHAKAIGELVEVEQPVDVEEEMSAIGYLVAKQKPSPAVLFNTPAGFEKSPIGARHLWNVYGPSVRRIALSLEEHPDTPTVELIRRTKDKMKKRTPPRTVPDSQVACFENTISGKDIDLTKLPIPRHWPLDGGNYAGTCDAVITRDPDTGYLNVGTYRMMVQDKNHTGLYLSPGKDARLHITRAWSMGQSVPVVACWGIDPLFMLVGSQSFPKTVSEYEYAGGIKGEPIAVAKARHSDLLFPASAEFVVEGVIHPQAMAPEGPFGEFTGYYGKPEAACAAGRNPRHPSPHQSDPDQCADGRLSVLRAERVLLDPARRENLGRSRQARHTRHLRRLFPPRCRRRLRHDDFLARAEICRPCGAGAGAGGAGAGRLLLHQVDHRRGRGRRSFRHGPGALGHGQPLQSKRRHRHPAQYLVHRLDPSQNPPEIRPYGSKALINACKQHRYIPVFSKRTKLRKSIYDKVADRWSEMGLPGAIPNILAFEAEGGTESANVYHDEKAMRDARDMQAGSAAKPATRKAAANKAPAKKK
jgi:3-polyprenyl-4-hydroxybenzoate decarboxylase